MVTKPLVIQMKWLLNQLCVNTIDTWGVYALYYFNEDLYILTLVTFLFNHTSPGTSNLLFVHQLHRIYIRMISIQECSSRGN